MLPLKPELLPLKSCPRLPWGGGEGRAALIANDLPLRIAAWSFWPSVLEPRTNAHISTLKLYSFEHSLGVMSHESC